ncbi:MAG: tail fiber domain-containing protein, partial [Fimbriimonadales bacterium]|nr:tail fiber domain-containing protein [Fimbriimonadales bacterium]
IYARGGGLLEDWPGTWDGGIATFDIVLATAYGWDYWRRSDENYKQNINPLGASDSMRLLSLRPVSYEHRPELIEQYGAPKGVNYGFIAQEVQQIFPELVIETQGMDGDPNKKGYGVNYIALIPHLVNVVQQQQREINELRALVQQLQSGAK